MTNLEIIENQEQLTIKLLSSLLFVGNGLDLRSDRRAVPIFGQNSNKSIISLPDSKNIFCLSSSTGSDNIFPLCVLRSRYVTTDRI